MIRACYQFRRPLCDAEAALLQEYIGWRRGSRVCRNLAGQVDGAICHPDDLRAYEQATKTRIVKRKVAVAGTQTAIPAIPHV
jgi:hypothetical protein